MSKGGRPEIPLELCSDRSKRKKTEVVRIQISKFEFTYATSITLRLLGEKDAAKLLK